MADHRGDSRSSGNGSYRGRHVRGDRRVVDPVKALKELMGFSCPCCEEFNWTSPDDDALCISCDHSREAHKKEFDGLAGSEFEWTS